MGLSQKFEVGKKYKYIIIKHNNQALDVSFSIISHQLLIPPHPFVLYKKWKQPILQNLAKLA